MKNFKSFHIEPAVDTDWPWIVQGQIEIAWMNLSKERQREVSREEIEEKVRRWVEVLQKDENFHNEAFVAKTEDGTLAGFVWVARDQNDSTGQMEGLLLNQYVAEPYRGQGLGRRLMKVAEDWARKQGLTRISLALGVHSTIGRRLYESLGYQAETLRMSKRLVPNAADELLLIND